MNLIQSAAGFAKAAHANQVRKYTNEPYWHHCQEVAEIVKSVGGSDEMIAGSWLHDVLEDCPTVKAGDIWDLFGIRVHDLVTDLTDVSKPTDGNRRVRKEIDRRHTAQSSPDAKTIKLADLISNSRTIIPYDPDFARVYMAEKRRLLDVLREGNATLYAQAEQILVDYETARLEKKLESM